MAKNHSKRRCTATTNAGARCRCAARPGETLCAMHLGLLPTMPMPGPEDDARRCTALTAKGSRCRLWATPGETRCYLHLGFWHKAQPGADDARRCTAQSLQGRRCRRWAMRGETLCAYHLGLQPPLKSTPGARDDARRCTATNVRGKRCHRWAMHGRELCEVHAGRGGFNAPLFKEKQRCTATTLWGERCRRFALEEDALDEGEEGYERQPQLCWLHAFPRRHPRLRHAYYSRRVSMLTAVEQAVVQKLWDQERGLDAEVALARFTLRALAGYLNRSELSVQEDLNTFRLIFRGAGKVGRLVVKARKL